MYDLDYAADQLFYYLFEVPDNETDNTEPDDTESGLDKCAEHCSDIGRT
jgi:hypothetical protein